MPAQEYVPADDLGVRLDNGCPECGHDVFDTQTVVTRRETHALDDGVLSYAQTAGMSSTVGFIKLVCGDCETAFVDDAEQVYEPSE